MTGHGDRHARRRPPASFSCSCRRSARVGYRYRPLLDGARSRLRQVLRLMAPATIGAAAVQVNVFVNSNFASYLGDGPVSWLNVAFRFMQLPIGLFGVAVGTVALPLALAPRRAAATPARSRATHRARPSSWSRSCCVPAAVGLAVLGVPVIGLIYEHGRFTSADTAAPRRSALAAYAIGLAGYAGHQGPRARRSTRSTTRARRCS